MKKLIATAVLAGSLMLVNTPEAAAHTEVRNVYQPAPYIIFDARRSHKMPRWLHRDRGFRHWYRHTSLQPDRRFTWHQLFEIYQLERRWGRAYSRNHWNDYYARRHVDRDRKERRRHRH